MNAFIGTVVLGALIILLGISNRKGNISSLHWYHRKRVTEENRLPFGKLVGLGTIICGASLLIFGAFSFAAEKSQNELVGIIGSAILVAGVVIGLALNFYAMIKYNKGIF